MNVTSAICDKIEERRHDEREDFSPEATEKESFSGNSATNTVAVTLHRVEMFEPCSR